MKFLIVLALIGVACTVPAMADGSGSLADAFSFLRHQLPLVEAKGLFQIYVDGDAEVCEFAGRIAANGNGVIDAVYADPAIKRLMTRLEAENVPIRAFLNEIWKTLGIQRTSFAVPVSCTTSSRGGVRAMMNNLRTLFNRDNTRDLINGVKAINPSFAAFHADMAAERASFNTVRNLPEVQGFARMLSSYGVQTDHIIALIQALFGWA